MDTTNRSIFRCFRQKPPTSMKRLFTFSRTWQILSVSYLRGTLVHGSSYGCAVSNMIQSKKIEFLRKKLGLSRLLPILKGEGGDEQALAMADRYLSETWRLHIMYGDPSARSLVRGYTIRELEIIDRAFNSYSSTKDPDGFMGLHAVLEELMQIHDLHGRTQEKALRKRQI